MSARPAAPGPPAGGFKIQDVFYTLFRHKGKIVLLAILGLAVGAGLYLRATPAYTSESRLLVRYVVENREITSSDGPSVRSPEGRGSTVLSAETQIITSLDLAREVVQSVGVTNIIRNPEVADPLVAALGEISRGLSVTIPRNSSVLLLHFTHPDREIARRVLDAVVEGYLRFHGRIHRALDVLDEVDREVQLRRGALERTETDLRRLRSELELSGVSLEDARRTLFDQIQLIRNEILNTEALLAERRVMAGINPNEPLPSPEESTANTPSTNTPAALPPAPSPETLSDYRNLLARIEALNRREQDLLMQFTADSVFVKAVRDLLREATSKRQQLEQDEPGLLTASTTTSSDPTSSAAQQSPQALVAALESKLRILNSQLAQLRAEGTRISEREAQFVELQRRRTVEEQRYLEFAARLDRARLDETLSREKIGNIRVLQAATPAFPTYGNQQKIAMGVAGGGLALGLALAFLLEMVTDRTVRRPTQVEQNLRLPLFLSIPRLHLNGRAARRRLKSARRQAKAALQAPPSSQQPTDTGSSPELALALHTQAPGDTSELAPFAEALRDRLMMYFQLHGLNHKPKLVGITSCGHKAGVTSLATSLAASLSETGDGNVLYVDVNPDQGPSVHPFHRGKLGVGIRDALETSTRDSARVHHNLYKVSLADPATGKIGVIPKTLSGLVPKMKASDYDYIIFDLPPVSQTSATAKVAGLLDMTFLVLESETTQTDLARNANALLSESRANVAAVLNKHRRYLPQSMDTDL